jgi:ribonuclease HI
MKINWDTGVDIKNGKVGLGVVIRDRQGRMWASRSRTVRGCLDPITGELLAALMVVHLCREMGIQNALFEGDAKVVVEAITSGDLDESSRGHLLEDIRVSLRGVPRWKLNFVRREGNKVAHQLAAWALREEVNKVWLYHPPIWLQSLLKADISALSSD